MSDEDEWTAADEWASWMFPGAYLPRFEDVPKVKWMDARRPLHERIQEYIDRVNPETATPRGPWMADLRVRTPGETGEEWAGRITDFELTVDNDLETHDDLADAARMHLSSHHEPDDWGMPEFREDGRAVGYEEHLERLRARRDDHDGREPLPVTFLEAEAQEELTKTLPRYCPSCGSDHVRVTIEFEEGEPVETQLQCSSCEPGQQ